MKYDTALRKKLAHFYPSPDYFFLQQRFKWLLGTHSRSFIHYSAHDKKCVLISKSDFISLLNSLPTRYDITVFVCALQPFNLGGKYNATPFQPLGDNYLSFLRTNFFYKGAEDCV